MSSVLFEAVLFNSAAFHGSHACAECAKNGSHQKGWHPLTTFHYVGHPLCIQLLSRKPARQKAPPQKKRISFFRPFAQRSDSIKHCSCRHSGQIWEVVLTKKWPPLSLSQCHINCVMALVLNGVELILRSEQQADEHPETSEGLAPPTPDPPPSAHPK